MKHWWSQAIVLCPRICALRVLLVKCSLPGKEIVIQVMNISPTPVTVYTGMRLGEAVPRHSVLLVDNMQPGVQAQTDHPAPDFNLDDSNFSPLEKTQLANLLKKFASLYLHLKEDKWVGRK